jgi:glyoxylase-like metal-dependent hydrolase (beta-lactamase superfamily II)
MKRSLLNIAFVVLGMMLTASLSVFTAQQVIRTPKQTPYPKNPDWAKQELDVLKVQGQVYLIAGAGGNIAAQVGDECVLLVDTGYAQMAPKVVAEIRKLSKQPLRTIINTTLMESHTGANGLLVKEGRQIDNTGPGLGGRPNEADLTASASLLALMTEIGRDKIPVDRWPPSTFPGKQKDLFSNDEPVVIQHLPGVTEGDSIVWFRKSDVVATGEVMNMASFPYIDVAHGGSINGILESLNTILDITVPKHNQEGGTMVIPGYGRIGDEHDVLEYRDMLTIIRDRVQNAMKKGMTLQQIKALKPSLTYEYEPRFNRDPAWTAEMFVEAIHKNLSVAK